MPNLHRHPDGGLLTVDEAALHLGYAPRTLRSYASRGIGPKVTKLPSGGVRYALHDLREWVASGHARPGRIESRLHSTCSAREPGRHA